MERSLPEKSVEEMERSPTEKPVEEEEDDEREGCMVSVVVVVDVS